MAENNNDQGGNNYGQCVYDGFEKDLFIKASVLKPGIHIAHLKRSNKQAYGK